MTRPLRRITLLLLPAALLGIAFISFPHSNASVDSRAFSTLLPSRLTTDSITFTLSAAPDDVNPRDKIDFLVEIESSAFDLHNAELILAVTEHPNALEYQQGSGIVQYGEDIARLDDSPIRAPIPFVHGHTLTAGKSVRIEWQMTVRDCAPIREWIQVAGRLTADEIKRSIIAHKNVFSLGPVPSEFQNRRARVNYSVDKVEASPGDMIRHQYSYTNTGHLPIDNVFTTINAAKSPAIPVLAKYAYYLLESSDTQHGITTITRDSEIALEPAWTNPNGGFEFNYLNPGDTLVMTWFDQAAADATPGTEVVFQIDTKEKNSTEWASFATRTTVGPIRTTPSLSFTARPIYPRPNAPGSTVEYTVVIGNRSSSTLQLPVLHVDLPIGLTYEPDSAVRAVGDDRSHNARRLGDAWLANGLTLPPLASGEWTMVQYRATIGDNVPIGAILRSYARLYIDEIQQSTAQITTLVEAHPQLILDVDYAAEIDSGSEASYEISIRNEGDAPLEPIALVVHLGCGVTYIENSASYDSQKGMAGVEQHAGLDAYLRDSRSSNVFAIEETIEPGTLVHLAFRVSVDSELSDRTDIPMRFSAVVPTMDNQFENVEVIQVARRPQVTAADLQATEEAIIQQTAADLEATKEAITKQIEELEDATDRLDERVDNLDVHVGNLSGAIGDPKSPDSLVHTTGVLRETIGTPSPAEDGDEELSTLWAAIEATIKDVEGNKSLIEKLLDLEWLGLEVSAALIAILIGAIVTTRRRQTFETLVRRTNSLNLPAGLFLMLLIGGFAFLCTQFGPLNPSWATVIGLGIALITGVGLAWLYNRVDAGNRVPPPPLTFGQPWKDQ